ncbi:MAG: hypothetical protein ABI831_10895 [Betaproteobacteria bacterium]
MNAFKSALLSLLVAHGALAATPQASTMEFFHTGLQHYFVTADAVESLAIDNGSAGEGWVRTGRSFGIWNDPNVAPASTVSVCRFYSSGSHAHFYTAEAAECAQLRALQASQSAAAAAAQRPFTGWAFEGNAFFAQVPTGGQCPASTEPVFRFYSDGLETGSGSSHRFVSDPDMAALMQSRGWVSEGIAFCSPVTASGTSAPATPSTGTFPEIAATWTGAGKWEFEVKPDGAESRTTAPVSLTIAVDGSTTGIGAGCTIAGAINSADGFHSLYRGSVTTTACTDTHFNGTFPLRLERLGATHVNLQFGSSTSTLKVEVEALLSSGAAPPPPPPPPSPSTGSTTYIGTVAWIVSQRTGGGNSATVSAANQALSLTLNGAALTGAGAGCAFTGNVQTPVGGKMTGTATATGCQNAAFNGTYAQVKLNPEDGAVLEIEFEKETQAGQTTANATIRGGLVAQGGTVTPPPPPPPGTPAVTGAWTGDARWLAEQRSGGNTTTLVSTTSTLSIAVATGGMLTGTGLGCTFAGTLQTVVGGLTGTVSATGCQNSNFNGNYSSVGIHSENSGAIEVEFERETEGGGTSIRVSISGILPASSGGVTPPPPLPPPAAGFALPGTWSSAQAQWTDERRQSGVTSSTTATHVLTLTIAADGTVNGSGFGCLFAGRLNSVSGSSTTFSGPLSASGCTNADFNGSYGTFGAHTEDNQTLDVEMEHESESGGLRVRASVDGVMTRQ